MHAFDVIVIGSGGGVKITSPAAGLGLKVAVIEKDALGGTCLNRGCIPSKMLVYPADIAEHIREAPRYDVHPTGAPRVNFARLVRRISRTVDTDSADIATAYSQDPNITYLHGEARFTDHHTITVNGKTLTAPKIFLAVGSRPLVPAIKGLADTPFLTSTEALRNTHLPRRLAIIGSGYIAAELGHAYGALGAEVHFLVRSQFLKREDDAIIEEFTRVISARHHVHAGARPTRVRHDGKVFRVTYTDAAGDPHMLTTDALLVAAGVTPNGDTLNLAAAGVPTDAAGHIVVDDHLQTPVPGVWAFGDCIGRYYFRHSANFEGEYLFSQVFGGAAPAPIRYPPMPHAVFTHPQVAAVGPTERELQADGVEYVAGTNPYSKSAMGMAMRSESGFCKLLFDRATRRLLGAHILGEQASNMIHMLIILMNMRGTLDDLLGMVYVHPALPEIVRNAARVARANFEDPRA